VLAEVCQWKEGKVEEAEEIAQCYKPLDIARGRASGNALF